MDKKILCFKQDNERRFAEFYDALNKSDVLKASSLFWRIKDNVEPEIYLMQAAVYSKINNIEAEINCILKYLTFNDGKKFNPVAVLQKLHFYFFNFQGVNTLPFYQDLIFKKIGEEVKIDNTNEPQEENFVGLKLVGDNSKEKFFEGMELFLRGKYDGAVDAFGSIKKEEEYYNRGVVLKAMAYISQKKYSEAVSYLVEEIKKDADNYEYYSLLYKVVSSCDNLSAEECDQVLSIRDVSGNYDLVMAKGYAAIFKGDFSAAIVELKKLDGQLTFSEDYLKTLARCYYHELDYENFEKTLKKQLSICPGDALVRYTLLKKNENEDVFAECFESVVAKRNKIKFKKYVNKLIADKEFALNATVEENLFLLKLSFLTEDFEVVKKACEASIKNGFISVVLDMLIDVTLSYGNRQLVFQAVLEEKYSKNFYILLNGLLKEIKVDYPEVLLKPTANEKKSKLRYLTSIYAQSYSMLLFIGADLNGFKEFSSKVLEYMFDLPYESSEDEFIRDSEKMVYMFSIKYCEGNEQIEESFKFISEEEKNKAKLFFEQIKTKID